MKIGLINIEPKIVNTAYMQIAHYHKSSGNEVEWAMPLEYDQYDKLYCSSLFDFTNKNQVPKRAVCGGSGYDLTTELPFDCEYDYSIYPDCDYSIQWFSRGCIRNCPFCLVQKKEGGIRPVQPKNGNANGEYIVIQDNNFFANPEWRNAVQSLKMSSQPVDFAGGIDARLLDKEKCEALNSFRHVKQIKMAWDDPRNDLSSIFSEITSYIKPYKIMVYVLIGYWSTPEEDLFRIESLRKLKIDPFVMAYNKKNYYQRRFARWVNHKAIFKSVAWKDYK